ncbi:MAG: hypothetical protein QFB87_03145 [Patescibacteria group bacterium]|nr:hypothetical protein [Patescibacteria group bacterium]
MATPARYEQSASCQTAVGETMPPTLILPRQRDGGSFSTEYTAGASSPASLPFSLEVSDWQELPNRYDVGVGLTETSLVTVADTDSNFRKPSRFIIRKIIPDTQRFATSVDMMPPLGTRVNGYNTYIARKLAQQGIHTRIVGTNQTKGYSMLHDTQATMAILRADDQRSFLGAASCTPNTSLDLGYSMGEMKAFAKQSLAPQFGWNIVMNKGIDPCVAEQLGYNQLMTKEMLSYYLADAALVPKNIFHNILETGLSQTVARSRRWMGTVSLAPCFASNTYDKWSTILTGEAGTFLKHAAKDTPVVLHSFDGSKLNHRDAFEAQLADFPNASFVHEKGRHLSAACASAVGNLVRSIGLSLELIESGASKRDIVEASSQPILPRR